MKWLDLFIVSLMTTDCCFEVEIFHHCTVGLVVSEFGRFCSRGMSLAGNDEFHLDGDWEKPTMEVVVKRKHGFGVWLSICGLT